MANNIKDLRLAFLLTPKQLADRLGVEVDLIKKLEKSNEPLAEEWTDALALALGVPASAITDPDADLDAVAATAKKSETPKNPVCRVGARFAVQSMVAKLGGLNMALNLSEDALAKAVQNIVAYAEQHDDSESEEQQVNRLSQSLQIAVLTILQSREVEPDRRFEESMTIARNGALSLMQSFSQIDRMNRDAENE